MVGIVLWGLGAALGFPVGMSAAGDDPLRAAHRVAVVSTIGYGAFLAGPPLLGFVGDHVGTLDSLLVIAVAMLPAAVMVLAVRRPRTRWSSEGRRSPSRPADPGRAACSLRGLSTRASAPDLDHEASLR